MFKVLSAALVAASILVAPIAASAGTLAVKPVVTKQVTMKQHHKRHIVKHRAHAKFARHTRHFKTIAHKRHATIVKLHRRGAVARTRAS